MYEGFWNNHTANGKGRLIHADGDAYVSFVLESIRMVNGLMTEHKGTAHTIMLMVQSMKENGLRTNNMGREQKSGQMALCMRGFM